MNAVIAVFIGGGFGSLARYGIGKWISGITLVTFPYATLTANILSSLILGVFVGATSIKPDYQSSLRFLIAVGFCGGFSTFSTFSAETFELFKNGLFVSGILNIGLNLVACISMIGMGIWLGKTLFS